MPAPARNGRRVTSSSSSSLSSSTLVQTPQSNGNPDDNNTTLSLSQTVCILCRHRKSKCDRRLPRCGLCAKTDLPCDYINPGQMKKRGLRAGYVAQLERRLELLEREVGEIRGGMRMGREKERMGTGGIGRVSGVEVEGVGIDGKGVKGLEVGSQRGGGETSLETGTPESVQGVREDGVVRWGVEDRVGREEGMGTEMGMGGARINVEKLVGGMEMLAPDLFADLLDTWFSDYYRWVPILHKPSLIEALQGGHAQRKVPTYIIVFKAIAAVTLADAKSAKLKQLSTNDRKRLVQSFRCQVVMEAMGSLSLQSLQALLIITILDYGAGKFSDCWNLIAVCKGMATQLGLRDLIRDDSSERLFTVPPRMLPPPSNSIEREERVRAYWMIETLDGYTTLGASWNLCLLRPPLTKVLPCNEDDWDCTEPLLDFFAFGNFESPSSFALYVSFVTNELFEVHHFLQQSYHTSTQEECQTWDREFRKVEAYLKDWRARNNTIAGPFASYVASPGRTVRFDPTIVLANTGYNIAIIALNSRLALPPHGFENYLDDKSPALERCLDACNDLAAIIGAVSDKDLLCICPHFIFDMFVAARFFLVNARAFANDLPMPLNALLHAYSVCQKRWRLARNLEKVLRMAVDEHTLPLSAVSLPRQFYDMQYVALDVYEALRKWAEEA